jgi:hypothetical protein
MAVGINFLDTTATRGNDLFQLHFAAELKGGRGVFLGYEPTCEMQDMFFNRELGTGRE